MEERPDQVLLHQWQGQVAELLLSQGLSTPEAAETDASFYFSLDVSRHSAYARVEDSVHGWAVGSGGTLESRRARDFAVTTSPGRDARSWVE